MASGCKSVAGCVDSRVPIRATYVNLFKPESDAEFVRSVITGDGNPRKRASSPRVVDSYSCRQMYLRSYTFSTRETVPEKTRRCFERVRERASDFPSFIVRSSSTASASSRDAAGAKRGGAKGKGGSKGKSCPAAKKLRDVSCSAIASIFRRLLSCTSSVDVVVVERRSRA